MTERRQATPDTMKLVWDQMVGNDRMIRYYGYLVDRYKSRDMLFRWIAAILSSGPLVAFLLKGDRELEFWVPLAFLAAAALNIWIAHSRIQESIAYCVDIHRQLSRLSVEWKDLWASADYEDDAAIKSRWRDLSNQTAAVVAEAPSRASFVKKIASRSQDESYEYWKSAHA